MENISVNLSRSSKPSAPEELYFRRVSPIRPLKHMGVGKVQVWVHVIPDTGRAGP